MKYFIALLLALALNVYAVERKDTTPYPASVPQTAQQQKDSDEFGETDLTENEKFWISVIASILFFGICAAVEGEHKKKRKRKK